MNADLGEMRVVQHPVLGDLTNREIVCIWFDGQLLKAVEGETILAALAAHGLRRCRTTARKVEPRWFFCGLGRCTDCLMIVDGMPNVRTCVTAVVDGMCVETQHGVGHRQAHVTIREIADQVRARK